jgi:hypothetical protein
MWTLLLVIAVLISLPGLYMWAVALYRFVRSRPTIASIKSDIAKLIS